MREPLKQVADMHLVGLVIAGQRVHHQINAAAQREFVLAAAAGRSARKGLSPSASLAHPAARSLEVMITGETPSPERAGRAPPSVGAGGNASIQVAPLA